MIQRLILILAGLIMLVAPAASVFYTGPFPIPIQPVVPQGSLIYGTSFQDSLDALGEVDTFNVDIEAGQTLSIKFVPQDVALQASIELVGPSAVTVATLSAPTAGDTVVIQTVSISVPGVYSIKATSLVGAGVYDLEVFVNSAIESESYSTVTNDTLETAQDLGMSAVTLMTGADRLAVVGQAQAAGDYYSFFLNQGDSTSLALSSHVSSPVTIELQGGVGTVLALGLSGNGNPNAYISDFVAPAAGIYYARVSGDNDNEYSLVVTRNLHFDVDMSVQGSGTQDISTTLRVLGGVDTQENGVGQQIRVAVYDHGGLYSPLVDQLNDDTHFNFQAIAVSGLDIDTQQELDAYDVVILGLDTSVVAPTFLSALRTWVESGRGGIVGIGGVLCNLNVGCNNGIWSASVADVDAILPVDATVPLTLVELPATVVISSVEHQLTRDILDINLSSSTILTEVSSAGIDIGATLLGTINDAPVIVVGTSGGIGRSVYLGIGFGLVFTDPALSTGVYDQLLEQAVAWAARVRDHQFEFSALEGDTLIIETATPGDGSGEPENTLDPVLELFSPDMSLVATDDNSSADGRNAQIVYPVQAGESGIHRVAVAGGSGTGNYTLTVSGTSSNQNQAPKVVEVTPADGAIVASFPAQFDVVLSEAIRVDVVNVSAGELSISTGHEFLDGRTVRFTLPALGEGAYPYTIGAGTFIDLQGQPNVEFQGSFTVDQTGPRVTTQVPSSDLAASAPLNEISFTFSENIDPESFTVEDVVSFTGPGGVNLIGQITEIVTAGNIATVSFSSQVSQGQYSLTIGPDILDFAGNPMDQNQNSTKGEAADVYEATVVITSADLIISSVGSPVTAEFGETIQVSWTVQNIGNDSANATWFDSVYLSSDENIGPNDTVLLFLESNDVSPVAGGSQYMRTADVTLPLDLSLANGTYYIIVLTDAGNNQIENDENNNINTTQSIELGLPPLPDLNVNSVQVPQSAKFGQTIEVSWTVENIGTAPANSIWIDRVYLSSDPFLSSDSVLLNLGASDVSPLADGSEYTRTENITLPLDFSAEPGAYYIIIETDAQDNQLENDEGNNVNATQSIILSLPTLPDLVVSDIVAPVEIISGQQMQISWVVTNQGEAEASGSWLDSVFVSSDQVIGNDTSLGVFEFTGALAPGESVTRTQSIDIPITLSGTHWLGVTTDVPSQIFEHSNEDNNSTFDNLPLEIVLAPFPNLQVTGVTVPPAAFSGQQTVITWTVTNVGSGDTDAPIWFDAVWLSVDNTLDASDTYLGQANNPSYLGAAQSYVNNLTVTLPQGIDGDYYLIVKTDNNAHVNELMDENDNIGFGGPMSVQLTPPPDLQVNAVSAPAQAFSGQTLMLNWTVINSGIGDTDVSSWKDNIYMSADETIDGGDYLVGQVTHTGTLNSGESYSVSHDAVLPVGVSGDYFFIVQTDAQDGVFEHVFESNNTGSDPSPTTVNLTPPPDIEILSVDAPGAVTAGHAISISYTVANNGSTATPNFSWNDAFYLSTDTILDTTTDLLLGQRAHTGALNIGASYTESASMTIPEGVSGSYYVFVLADNGDQVFEAGAEANNSGFDSVPTQIVIQPADLVVSTASAPDTADAGSVIQMDWTVVNQGTGATAVSTWIDRVYASSDSVVGGDDVLLGSFTHTGFLGVGQSYTQSQLVTIPFSLIGQYNFFVISDDDSAAEGINEGNNASAPLAVSISRDTPDLQVSQLNAPMTALSGSVINMSWTVRNAGIGATNTSYWYDDVYLSTDTVLDTSNDLKIDSVYHSGSLGADAVYSVARDVVLPGTLDGDYYLIVNTDNTNLVEEGSFEINNSLVSNTIIQITLDHLANPTPDLKIVSVEAPANILSGQVLDVTWTVQNNGDATGNIGWDDAVYLSFDQVFDPANDAYLGFHRHTGGLLAGQTYTKNESFSIPPGMAGYFYVFVVTGSSGQVDGGVNDPNNISYLQTSINIAITPPADLVVGTITVPVNGVPGQNATIDYTVHNQGVNPALGIWRDSLYLSADTQWDIGDKLFGQVEHSGAVVAGDNYSETLTAPLPGVLPGDYHVIVRSDILNHIQEIDDNNNVAGSLNSVALDAQEISVNQPVNGSLASGQSAYYKVQVVAGETLVVDLDSTSSSNSNELFIKFGGVPSRGEFDYSYQSPFDPDQRVIIPETKAGTYYILAYGDRGTTSPFSLTASLIDFDVFTISPDIIDNAGSSTLYVTGAKFDVNTSFELDTPEGVRTSSAVYLEDSSHAYVTIDFSGLPPGSYSLAALQDGGQRVQAPTQINVQTGLGGHFIANLSGPSRVRPQQLTRVRVTYGNDGGGDLIAPLVFITNENGIPFGFSDELTESGSIAFLALSNDGPSNILRPGQSHTIDLFYRSNAGSVEFDLEIVEASSLELLNSDALAAVLQPSGISEDEWQLLYERFLQRIDGTGSVDGPTNGELVTALGDAARSLQQRGSQVSANLPMSSFFRQSIGDDGGALLGKLTDDGSGLPISGTEIFITSEEGIIIAVEQTEDNGAFTIDGLPEGIFGISIPGYSLDEQNSTIEITHDLPVSNLDLNVTEREIFSRISIPLPELSTHNSFGQDAFQFLMFEAASAAYLDTPVPDDLTPVNTLEAGQDPTGYFGDTNNSGFGAYALKDIENNLTIAFRGTDTAFSSAILDAFTDIGLGRRQWLQNKDRILNFILNYLESYPAANVNFTGHSLGGGLAQFAAYEIKKKILGGESEWASHGGLVVTLTTFNGVGVQDEIRNAIDGGGEYSSSIGGQIVNQHFSYLGDIVSLMGSGHVGGNTYSIGVCTSQGAFYPHGRERFIDEHVRIGLPVIGDPVQDLRYFGPDVVVARGFIDNWINSFQAGELDEAGRVEGVLRMLTILPLIDDPDVEKGLKEIQSYFATLAIECDGFSEVDIDRMLSLEGEHWFKRGFFWIAKHGSDIGFGDFTVGTVLLPVIGTVDHGINLLEQFGEGVVGLGRIIQSITEVGLARSYQEITEFGVLANQLADQLEQQAADKMRRLGASLVNTTSGLIDRAARALSFTIDLEIYAFKLFFGDSFGVATYSADVIRPSDPNDIVGPAGFGAEHWVSVGQQLPYMIRFENEPTATAPVQNLSIIQQLDSDLDWRTFRLTEISWGDFHIQIPEERAFYSERVDRTEDLGIYVDVFASVNVTTGEIFLLMNAIDPATGEQPLDADTGFLPVNDGNGSGEGFVSYTVRPKSDTITGETIDAVARIIFDTEEPVDTPPIFNTVDAEYTDTTVTALPSSTTEQEFQVMWGGSDFSGGSGLADYSIYVSDNGGPYMAWINNSAVTGAPFTGEFGHTYAFYSSARDNAGNVEPPPAQADAIIEVIDPVSEVDTDGDGITDLLDNCINVENSSQLDTDADGYGNYCDADFNNDGIVNALDLGLFKQAFFTFGDVVYDINGDGLVNALDLGLFKQLFFKPPGPSGLVQ